MCSCALRCNKLTLTWDNLGKRLTVSGDAKSTRMQHLLEIVSYLDAIKSSCLAAIPTPEELECYQLLSKLLDYNSISCFFPVEETGKQCD